MTELNTYSNAVESRPITWADITYARDAMRIVIRGQPSMRATLQMSIAEAELQLACAKVDLLMGSWGRSHINDFGHGIFDPATDPELLAAQQKVARLSAHRSRMRVLLLQSQIPPEPGG